MSVRVAIYCRLSKEDEKSGESESIVNQKHMLEKYAIDRSWDIVGIYADDDFSGTDSGRPQWNEMLELCKKGKVDVVLCKTQSRFSRDMSIIEKYIHGKFVEWGVRFISVVDNADTENKGNKKARQIMALTNEWYVEEISDNIRAVFSDKMHKGEYIATFAPYGYKKDGKRLVIDEDVAGNVRQIFEWRLEGLGMVTIARKLNEMGIPNPRKHQEDKGLRKTLLYSDGNLNSPAGGAASGVPLAVKPPLWNNYTVSDILKNPTYCGDTVQSRYRKVSYKSKKIIKQDKDKWIVVQDTHQPLVERNVFEAVQKEFTGYARSTKIGEVHLFAGKVFCSKCERIMQLNNSSRTNAFMRCRNKYLAPDDMKCQTPNISMKKLTAHVKDKLAELLKNYTKGRTFQTKRSDFESILSRKQELESQIAINDKAIKEAFLSKVKGIISEDEFVAWSKDFSNRKQDCEKEMLLLQEKLDKKEMLKSQEVSRTVIIEQFLEDNAITRGLIIDLIDKIVVFPKDNEGKIPIEVHWGF